MQVNKRLATKLFNEKEILSTEKFYHFIKRSKIIVFVPDEHTEKVMIEMFKAGSGKIGNYEMCSFSTKGTGTYKPNEKAKPFAGKRSLLSKAAEIKFEVECDQIYLNEVINVMLKHHPYEEIAYEIHSFRKRGKEEAGIIVTLKSNMNLRQLLKRINGKTENEEQDTDNYFKKVAIISSDKNEIIMESAKFTECEYLISILNNKYKLYKL